MMLSKFVISSVGRRGGVKVGKALFSSDAVATTGVLDKVMQDFDGKDSNIKIKATGKDTFDIETVEVGSKLDALKLEGDNRVALFMAQEAEKGGFLEAVGLGPWYKKASLGFMFGVTAFSKEMYIMNEETYVALCLGGFGFMAYMFAREPMLEWFNGEKKAILSAQNEAEDKHIAACETFLNSQGGTEGIEEELKELLNQKIELVELEAKANAIKEQHAVNAEFQRRLVSLVNQKADEQNQLYKEMIAEAKEYAAAGVKKADFQKVALEFAIKAISDPSKAGANPTGKLFEEYLDKRN